MTKQSDLFDRAEECERQGQLASDLSTQTSFNMLRDLWIALANHSANMAADRLAEEVGMLEKIQATLEASVVSNAPISIASP
jgi:hypothetical protein